jgi:hypothetical protein
VVIAIASRVVQVEICSPVVKSPDTPRRRGALVGKHRAAAGRQQQVPRRKRRRVSTRSLSVASLVVSAAGSLFGGGQLYVGIQQLPSQPASTTTVTVTAAADPPRSHLLDHDYWRYF